MVVRDAAGSEAEQALQVAVGRECLTGRAGLLGGDGEALIMLGEIGGEYLIGLFDRAGAGLT